MFNFRKFRSLAVRMILHLKLPFSVSFNVFFDLEFYYFDKYGHMKISYLEVQIQLNYVLQIMSISLISY